MDTAVVSGTLERRVKELEDAIAERDARIVELECQATRISTR